LRPDEWNERVSSLRKDQGREQNRDSGAVEKVPSVVFARSPAMADDEAI